MKQTRFCLKGDNTPYTGKKIIDYLVSMGGINKNNLNGYTNNYYGFYDNGDIIISGIDKPVHLELIPYPWDFHKSSATKVALRGDDTEETHKKIIDYLKNLGGYDNYIYYTYSKNFYYIDSNGKIIRSPFIPEEYTIIDYPWNKKIVPLPTPKPHQHKKVSELTTGDFLFYVTNDDNIKFLPIQKIFQGNIKHIIKIENELYSITLTTFKPDDYIIDNIYFTSLPMAIEHQIQKREEKANSIINQIKLYREFTRNYQEELDKLKELL